MYHVNVSPYVGTEAVWMWCGGASPCDLPDCEAGDAVASLARRVGASAVLDNWRTAPIDEKLRVTLGLLEKVTLIPWEIGPGDITPLRAEGVSEQAIEDALVVCALFNIIDRMADALDVAIPSAEGFARTAERLLEQGYL